MAALLWLMHAGANTVSADDPPSGCEPHWENAIGQPGANDGVLALTVSDAADSNEPLLYAGGSFTQAGGAPAGFIAQWHSATGWSALGGGVNAPVRNIVVFDDGSPGGPALYVGGMFTDAGGGAANHIARWDFHSGQWSPLGSGLDHAVRVLVVFDDGASGSGPSLYAGGTFTMAGDLKVNRIARWDGTEWSALGEGVNGTVAAVAVFDDGSGPALYVGGSFTAAGDIEANHIAKWDGREWSPLGSGMNHTVRTLEVFDDGSGAGPALYAGGRFSTAGGVEASFIAKWDGEEWSPLGSGTNDFIAVLRAFCAPDGAPALYAGGNFTTAGSIEANRIARWGGEPAGWSAVGSGTDFSVIDLAVSADKEDEPVLFIGGWFTIADDQPASRIAAYRVPQPHAPGDLNCDGSVGVFDLLALLAAWGECPDCDEATQSCPADLTGDCTVGVEDLLILLANWTTD